MKQRAVGQHCRRAVLQRQFEDRDHVAVQERLAAGEVILFHAEPYRFLQIPADRVQIEETERMIVRAATDKAMPAFEITQSTADLEPEIVEMGQRHKRRAGGVSPLILQS